jgi:hypothetical protein
VTFNQDQPEDARTSLNTGIVIHPSLHQGEVNVMNRRNVLMASGLALTGTALAARAEGQEKSAPADPHAAHLDHHARILADCLRECESCSDHCAKLAGSGQQEHLLSQKLCADCAEFCAAATRIVSRMGPLSELINQACAKACEMCAVKCDQYTGDAHMKRCAKICRDCAQTCREHSEHAARPGR